MAESASQHIENVLSVFLDNYPAPETEMAQPPVVQRRRKPCRFNQQGRCRFGSDCWNIHLVPDQPPIAPRNLKNRPQIVQTRSTSSNSTNWVNVNAPEFHPRPRSYAAACKTGTSTSTASVPIDATKELCILHETIGECPIRDQCAYIHGEPCDICQRNVLNPYDANQRQTHMDQCMADMERDMELSFAVQRSQDKCCGICMDVVLEKDPKSERRFGILERCNHVFCLTCIRKWRKSKNNTNLINVLDPVVTRGCPECRVLSDFIVPSQYWIEEETEKTKLIDDYKLALSKKPCKFFKRGSGTCPFGNACFYLHATPDGTKVVLPPPVRRRRQNQEGEVSLMDELDLWDFLELRDDADRLVRYALHNALVEDSTDDSEDDGWVDPY